MYRMDGLIAFMNFCKIDIIINDSLKKDIHLLGPLRRSIHHFSKRGPPTLSKRVMMAMAGAMPELVASRSRSRRRSLMRI